MPFMPQINTWILKPQTFLDFCLEMTRTHTKSSCHHMLPWQVQGEPSSGGLGLSWLWFCLFHCLPGSAWEDESLAERVEQLRKMVVTSKSNSTQPRSASWWLTLYRMKEITDLKTTASKQTRIVIVQPFLPKRNKNWTIASCNLRISYSALELNDV